MIRDRGSRAAAAPARIIALAAALAVAGAHGCATDPAGPGTAGDEILVAFDLDPSTFPQDDWDLASGRLVTDSLELTVQYAGGCREHRFRLLAVDGWIPLPDQGPTPTVGVPLLLSHDAGGDACEAWIIETLRFGLAPLEAAFRASYGDGPARLLLQITQGRDGLAIHVFDWGLEGR